MAEMYYLCFSINKLPDLTLTKYSVFDGSGVENIMDKHGIFLRQLHRLGSESKVYFHLMYYYDPLQERGKSLKILFYATSSDKKRLEGVREFVVTSVLSNYYEFHCYEIMTSLPIVSDQTSTLVLREADEKRYLYDARSIGDNLHETLDQMEQANGEGYVVFDIIQDTKEQSGKIIDLKFYDGKNKEHDTFEVRKNGQAVLFQKKEKELVPVTFSNAAYLSKKDYALPAQNRLSTDEAGEVILYSILEWEPCENGRLFQVLKLMEGYHQPAALRIDLFPIEQTQAIRQVFPYSETRRRTNEREQGKDDHSEAMLKSWDKYLDNLAKFPQFMANIITFANSEDQAIMLADSIGAEAVESGAYNINKLEVDKSFDLYFSDSRIIVDKSKREKGNYVGDFLSLYTLEEIRPMFSFPILYPGETVECPKETDPVPFSKNEKKEVIILGESELGYQVTFPVSLFKKHAFIAGVPGAGKTNTMLYLVTTLWRDTRQHIPFLVLEPAKQEYRALALRDGMEDLRVFSPGADTLFPLHINPFEFPEGLTLAEHIANLNAVFAGAFELPPPSPHFIDTCIEQVYRNKGWNINERNVLNKDGSALHEYPTLQELYDSLEVAVRDSHYQGETLGNLQSVLEVRVGSLLKREIGNVYNVRKSIMKPEDWLDKPVIIELEALGEGPANFMSLLISTLIREVLKVRKTSDIVKAKQKQIGSKKEIEHIIFYEEAHNLIGPDTDSPMGDSVDPKISATKYLVKMLAEVRALGEGIVIADQLPTAMAAEVLKNTGLKLAHRITAQDDRELLGGTMSASGEQLEEQGTFGTGQALIFYEGLQKPYKMQLCEWEKNRGEQKDKYDSPTNIKLYSHMISKENAVYRESMKRSAIIIQEKIEDEFGSLRKKVEDLVLKIKTSQRQDKMALNLKKLCWNYVDLYYTYITMARNYGEIDVELRDGTTCKNEFSNFSLEIYATTIYHYLTLFMELGELEQFPEYISMALQETEDANNDIKKYIEYEQIDIISKFEELDWFEELLVRTGFLVMAKTKDFERNVFSELDEIAAKNDENTKEKIDVLCEKMVNDLSVHLVLGKMNHELCKEVVYDMKQKFITYQKHENITRKARTGNSQFKKYEMLISYYESHQWSVEASICNSIEEIFNKLIKINNKNLIFYILSKTEKLRDMLVLFVNYRDTSAAALSKSYMREYPKFNLLLQPMSYVAVVEFRWKYARYDHQLETLLNTINENSNMTQEQYIRVKELHLKYVDLYNCYRKNIYPNIDKTKRKTNNTWYMIELINAYMAHVNKLLSCQYIKKITENILQDEAGFFINIYKEALKKGDYAEDKIVKAAVQRWEMTFKMSKEQK